LVPHEMGRVGPGDAALLLDEGRMAELRKLALRRYDYGKNKYLILYVYLSKNSTSPKVLNYQGWAAPPQNRKTPRLTDDLGNSYGGGKFAWGYEPLFYTARDSIPPGKTILDALVFKTPVAEAKHLTLELPVCAFGREGAPVRFRIQTSDVR